MRTAAHQAAESELDRRHRVVLWALALSRPQPVTMDQVAEALWSGSQPATRDKVIQGSISVLRKTYGRQSVLTVAGGYRLADDVVTSIDHFEGQVERGRRLLTLGQADRAAFVLADTLNAWVGMPYEGLAHWPPAAAEQVRLTEVTLLAQELYAEALLAAGRTEEALPEARHQAAAEPLRESRWLTWARAAYRSGNQAAALQALRDCRQVLDEELGVLPSDALDALELAILRQDPTLAAPQTALPSSGCPWPGLGAYEQDDAAGFFGREGDVARGLSVLEGTGGLAVAGPSGIGKSSLLRAGVASALTDSGLSVHVTTPQRGLPDYTPEVLVLDQAEELFALPREQALELLERIHGRPLVLSIRTDRMAEASTLPVLARVLERSLFLLGGLGADGLREAVERPAAQDGLLLEPGLVEVLLRDVGGDPGALPLFSHALAETWQRREGRTLTIDGYLSAGGVRGAVTQTAESLFGDLDASGQHELRSLMLRLVSTDATGETMRVRVRRQQVTAANDLVERLVTARLVTADNETISLTHEALITAWPRFGEWLADDVEGRRQLQHLAQAADSWEDMGRPLSELYRGPRLERATAWAQNTSLDLSVTERAFLAASQREHRAEKERVALDLDRQRRSNRRLRGLVVGLALVTALAVVAGGAAVAQQRASDTAARASAAAAVQADANRVGALALSTDDTQLSLLLAVAAQRLAPGVVTNQTLSAALASRPELIAAGATSTSTPPARLENLASGGSRVFALDASHVLHVLTPGLRTIGAVDVGDGGTDRGPAPLAAAAEMVAAATSPGMTPAITLTDALSLRPVQVALERLPHKDVTVVSLDLTPDGRALGAVLATTGGHLVMVWELPSGKLLGPPISIAQDATLRLGDDGETAFISGPVSAYDVSTGRLRWEHRDAAASTMDVNSSVVAVPALDGARVELLDASDGRTRRTLTGSEGELGDLAFSPGGALLAATTSSGDAVAWDVPSGQIAHRLETGSARGLAFSARGDTLFTGGSHLSSLLAWDLEGRRSFLTRIPRDGFQPLQDGSIAMSADGTWLAMSSTARERPELRVGTVEQSAVRVVLPSGDWRGVGAWNPQVTRFAYADGAGYLNVLDPSDRTSLIRKRVTQRPIIALTFTDNRSVLALDDAGDLLRVDTSASDITSRLPSPTGAVGLAANGRQVVVTSAGSGGASTSYRPASRWHLVDLARGQEVADGDVRVTSAAVASLSPDGSRMAFGGETGDVAILALPDGSSVGGDVTGSGERVSAMAWSGDGAQLVVSVGLALSLWDAGSGRMTAQVRLPAAEKGSVAAFATEGSISVLTRNGNLYRWDPSPDAAVAFVCRTVGRDLTATEWRDAFEGRTFRPACP